MDINHIHSHVNSVFVYNLHIIIFRLWTSLLLVCYSCVLFITYMYSYVTLMLLICTRMLLVCSFSHDLKIDHCLNYSRMRPMSSRYHDVFSDCLCSC